MSEQNKADNKEENQKPSFDAVDLMLDGNLQGQINYSLVKAVAGAPDEKPRFF